MFICKDCGAKYETKPDFCECGNDEFVEDNVSSSNKKAEQQKSAEEIKKHEKIKTPPLTFEEIKEKILHGNTLSVLIFLILIITSIIILMTIPSSKTQKEEQNIKKIQENKTNISTSVNWDVFEEQKITQPKVQQKSAPQTPQQIPEIKKEQNKQIPQTKKQPTKQITKPQTPKQTTQKPAATSNKPTSQTSEKKAEQQQKLQQEQKKQQQKALNEYKQALSKVFYYKIDFTNVIGQGSCEVDFKVNSNGTLTNKNFVKQSSNTTLNDAVFYGVKYVAKVSSPPSAYKGETLKLIVSFNNGNYGLEVR